ncbi:MAG: NAD-dependent epimerase/dehydratase [Hyphomicrobiales bacterium]|nr:NAD-dependent epimerase/dehydratase [Hyphomicrobiales bacterium]
MAHSILITGGGGFIGSHVARTLLRRGHRVRAYDSLIEQVHEGKAFSALLSKDVEFIRGDVRDAEALAGALRGVDTVVHLAAEVGVGQSMYAVDRYVSVNDLGTAVLMQELIRNPVRRVVVASSMSIYGEGLYRTHDGVVVQNAVRPQIDPLSQTFDPVDLVGRPLVPMPTPEWKNPTLASVYALTKYVQERLTLTLTSTYGMEGVALRLFNVYGPGQALSNPYTGVLAIFASRLLNDKAPLVFEDGEQQRDFVHVDDVAEAFAVACEHENAPGGVFNIGSGEHRPIVEIARLLASAMGREELVPEVVGKTRAGDIRHCFADISQAERVLGFTPKRDFADGLRELAVWVEEQEARDLVQQARLELEQRGLVA